MCNKESKMSFFWLHKPLENGRRKFDMKCVRVNQTRGKSQKGGDAREMKKLPYQSTQSSLRSFSKIVKMVHKMCTQTDTYFLLRRREFRREGLDEEENELPYFLVFVDTLVKAMRKGYIYFFRNVYIQKVFFQFYVQLWRTVYLSGGRIMGVVSCNH